MNVWKEGALDDNVQMDFREITWNRSPQSVNKETNKFSSCSVSEYSLAAPIGLCHKENDKNISIFAFSVLVLGTLTSQKPILMTFAYTESG